MNGLKLKNLHKWIFGISGMILFLMTMNLTSGIAQAVVYRGSTHRYSVVPAGSGKLYSYSWKVSGGTSSFFGSDAVSNPVLWDGAPGIYDISVIPTDLLSGCHGNMQHLKVVLKEFKIQWQELIFQVCSDRNFKYIDFYPVVGYIDQDKPWRFEYQVDSFPPYSVMIAGGTKKELKIEIATHVSDLTKSLHQLRIISVTPPDGHMILYDGHESDAGSHLCSLNILPMPDVDLGPDTALCSPDQLLLDAGNSGMTYLWSNGSEEETYIAKEGDGNVWVKVWNTNQCMGSDSIRILPCKTCDYLLIPNVFTPNGDGVNDDWRIGGLQNFPETDVKIFDRWGRLIFHSEPGYPRPWNGIREGCLLPMDAYYYIIDLKNGQEPYRGSVTLIP